MDLAWIGEYKLFQSWRNDKLPNHIHPCSGSSDYQKHSRCIERGGGKQSALSHNLSRQLGR